MMRTLALLFTLPLFFSSAFGASSVILEEHFDTPSDLGAFSQASVTSNFSWRWLENNFDGQFVEMNGFGTDGPSDDWMILTDPLDLGDFANPNLTFKFITNFGGPIIELMASSDYDPAIHADPADATWAVLPFYTEGTESEPDSGGWIPQFSDVVDLAPHKSDRLYIGFRYISTGSAGGEGAVWRVAYR